MKLLFSSLICCLFIFSGCEYKDHYFHIEFEQDSIIYSAYPDELDESDDYIQDLKDGLAEKDYPIGSNVVDNDIYNFVIVIPIKTKNDLYKDGSKQGYATIRTSNGSTVAGITYKHTLDINNTLHYNLYAESNYMKAYGLLDDIDDMSIDFNYYLADNYDRYHYTSNTVIIKAQEIKDMLDNLGISYE